VPTEIADLETAAARFAGLTGAGTQTVDVLSELVEAAGLRDRVELVADALAAGSPGASMDLTGEVTTALEPRSSLDRHELQRLVYEAAVRARLRRPDLGEVVGELDRWLEAAGAAEDGWREDVEAESFLQPVASGLVPLAGLDVGATLHYARVFIDNFPPFSLPLGDVDERATRWLAQLLDMGTIRTTLRWTLLELAVAYEENHPQAAGQLRAWSEAPIPADPTQDLPWMQALLPLARTQVPA
jgi:hypothetical protein